MKITVLNAREVQAGLRQILSELESDLPDAALESVQVTVQLAKAKVPVRTGHLRDSIIAEITEQTPTSVTIEIGPTATYGGDVEFGGLHRAAKPYLRPAADETEGAVVDTLVKKLNQLLDK